jgi:hypothetical protein
MAALANIKASTIIEPLAFLATNSATVADDKLFEPEGQIAPGVQRYVDRSSGIAVGYPSYTISVRRPVKGSRNYRVTEKLTYPVLNVTSPSTGSGIQPLPTVGYNLICNREWVLPEASTLAERKILLSLMQSLSVYGISASDSVPANPTGSVLHEAVHNLVGPY